MNHQLIRRVGWQVGLFLHAKMGCSTEYITKLTVRIDFQRVKWFSTDFRPHKRSSCTNGRQWQYLYALPVQQLADFARLFSHLNAWTSR